jgi:hypothetical protein
MAKRTRGLHHSPDVKTDDGQQVMAKAHLAFGKVSFTNVFIDDNS